jgi:glutamate decarboxylase
VCVCAISCSYLREGLIATGKFNINDKEHMPLVAFSLKDSSKYTVFDIQDKLRVRGWIVPAYTCPTGAKELAIMRVVVKQNFSCDMADMLLKDIIVCTSMRRIACYTSCMAW